MDSEEMSTKMFLSKKVAENDLILIQVINEIGPQEFSGRVMHIYSSGVAIDPLSSGSFIDFVSGPSTWGNMELKAGEKGLIFLGKVRDKLYEDPWHGHIWVEEVNDILCAKYDVGDLLERGKLPEVLSDNVVALDEHTHLKAFKFYAMETYLIDLINEVREQEAPKYIY